jgi:tetratricopeptide (TPR) repeat protein
VSQRKASTRKNVLLALLCSLLAILAWSYREHFAIAPPTADTSTRDAQPMARQQIYFGPPYSVAVLPFNCVRPGVAEAVVPGSNQSGADGPASGIAASYLTFGLAGSIQRLLQQMDSLHVTATTSSFFFAESTESLPVLAERLKVRHLLDGCVRQIDELLELELSLYDVRADSFTWSLTIMTPAEDIPDVIDQIIVQAAEEIRAGSGDSAPVVEAIGPAAWMKMLEGRQFARERNSPGLEQAEAAFKTVLELEPGHAPAWLGLARVYLHPGWPSTAKNPGYEQSRQAALKALDMDPAMAGAHLVLSVINRIYDWNFVQARKEARLALDILPGDAEILANASSSEFIFGRYRASVALLERSISRNPVVLNKLFRLGLAHEFAGDYDQALIIYRQLLGLNSEYPGVHAFRARVKLAQQNPESALRESEQELHPFWQRYSRILALDALERFEESDPLLEEMILENSHNAAFQLAEIHAMRGDQERAFEWLELAWEQRDGGMSEILGNVFLAGLHDDDRWSKWVDRMGLNQESAP